MTHDDADGTALAAEAEARAAQLGLFGPDDLAAAAPEAAPGATPAPPDAAQPSEVVPDDVLAMAIDLRPRLARLFEVRARLVELEEAYVPFTDTPAPPAAAAEHVELLQEYTTLCRYSPPPRSA